MRALRGQWIARHDRGRTRAAGRNIGPGKHTIVEFIFVRCIGESGVLGSQSTPPVEAYAYALVRCSACHSCAFSDSGCLPAQPQATSHDGTPQPQKERESSPIPYLPRPVWKHDVERDISGFVPRLRTIMGDRTPCGGQLRGVPREGQRGSRIPLPFLPQEARARCITHAAGQVSSGARWQTR